MAGEKIRRCAVTFSLGFSGCSTAINGPVGCSWALASSYLPFLNMKQLWFCSHIFQVSTACTFWCNSYHQFDSFTTLFFRTLVLDVFPCFVLKQFYNHSLNNVFYHLRVTFKWILITFNIKQNPQNGFQGPT